MKKFKIIKIIKYPLQLEEKDLKKLIAILTEGNFLNISFVYNEYSFKINEISEFIKSTGKEILNNLIIEAISIDNKIIIEINPINCKILATKDNIINEGLTEKLLNYLKIKRKKTESDYFVLFFFIACLILVLMLIFQYPFINYLDYNKIGLIFILFFLNSIFIPALYYLWLSVFPDLKIIKSKIILKKYKSFKKIKVIILDKNNLITSLIISIISIVIIDIIYKILKFILTIF
jgi:hypothetical protein